MAALTQFQAVSGLQSLSQGKAVSGQAVRVSAPLPHRSSSRRLEVTSMATKKKVNAVVDNWDKSWYSQGRFAESIETRPANIISALEKKKVLSGVEEAGLLSKLEAVGFSLSNIEKWGLLSKAESLGVLSLLEKASTTNPATLASLSLPLLVASVVVIVAVPDDTTVQVVSQYVAAGTLGTGALVLLVLANLLGSLQE